MRKTIKVDVARALKKQIKYCEQRLEFGFSITKNHRARGLTCLAYEPDCGSIELSHTQLVPIHRAKPPEVETELDREITEIIRLQLRDSVSSGGFTT